MTIEEIPASGQLHTNQADECFMRVGDKSKKLNFDERMQLLYDKGERYYEDKDVYGATINDVDMNLVNDYMNVIRDHIVDFLDPFRAGYYYKPAMNGSFSIKKVLPALFPDDPQLDYHNLAGGVQNGGEAMSIYPKMAEMTPEERERTRQALLDYCSLDTFAMVKVWEKLREVIK